ncbi:MULTISPECIES: hypothetical protein [Sinorhizobium]|uniref:Uncharacterized protein n=2 Tax=Sinorhizobium TaxID=28105 RepID=A0A4R2BK80_9HYPH|nr:MULTISPECIES: hypothetical protein [Sinorhizobium]AUX78872.1 hypothetical protein NXT3_PB00211 [Sinorhizobium fredii]TCN27638.1 hypothetical protein EV184_11596 [Sinorhizobium americanum]
MIVGDTWHVTTKALVSILDFNSLRYRQEISAGDKPDAVRKHYEAIIQCDSEAAGNADVCDGVDEEQLLSSSDERIQPQPTFKA